MPKIKKSKAPNKAQAQTFVMTKTALAVVEISKALIEPHGDHSIKVTRKKPRSSKYQVMIIHRKNLIATSGGEMDFDGTVSFRGVQEIYNSKGTIDAVDSETIQFTDSNGVRHLVPAATDSNIVLTIISEDLDKSEVLGSKKKKKGAAIEESANEGEEKPKLKKKKKKSAIEGKVKKTGKFPVRKVKKSHKA